MDQIYREKVDSSNLCMCVYFIQYILFVTVCTCNYVFICTTITKYKKTIYLQMQKLK